MNWLTVWGTAVTVVLGYLLISIALTRARLQNARDIKRWALTRAELQNARRCEIDAAVKQVLDAELVDGLLTELGKTTQLDVPDDESWG